MSKTAVAVIQVSTPPARLVSNPTCILLRMMLGAKCRQKTDPAATGAPCDPGGNPPQPDLSPIRPTLLRPPRYSVCGHKASGKLQPTPPSRWLCCSSAAETSGGLPDCKHTNRNREEGGGGGGRRHASEACMSSQHTREGPASRLSCLDPSIPPSSLKPMGFK